jgi:hypothetical protein
MTVTLTQVAVQASNTASRHFASKTCSQVTHTHTHTHTNKHTHTHSYTHTHTHTKTYIHTHTHKALQLWRHWMHLQQRASITQVCLYVCVSVCLCVCFCVFLCSCVCVHLHLQQRASLIQVKLKAHKLGSAWAQWREILTERMMVSVTNFPPYPYSQQ